MGWSRGLALITVTTLSAYLVHRIYTFYSYVPPKVPEIQLGYWKSGSFKKDDPTIRPYTVHFPKEDLEYLHKKLEISRELVRPLEGVAFKYGINSDYLQEFLNYWKAEYNWTQREDYLNQFPSYITQIGGLDIHFIHLKPNASQVQGKTVVPLLLVHGWPGSVREFYDLLPLLTTVQDDRDFVFEVVAPSLPGYGFSQPAEKPGLGPPQIAVILAELMSRVGFKTFYYQGGDWGSVIGHCISILYPKRVLGFHCNFCIATTNAARSLTFLSWLFPDWLVEESRRQFFKEQFFDSMILESGYYHIQATKPDTVGIALTDSPIGLAGYILEKFSTCTDKGNRELPDGGLSQLDREALLDNIMIYWLTKSITTAMRLYSENYVNISQTATIMLFPVGVPTHCARFPHELLFYPRVVLETQYSGLTSVSDFQKGGHFAALQVPQLLSEDLWDFVGRLRSGQAQKGKIN